MNRADRAEELFRQGYNCGQSVFAAFADVLGMTVEEAAKIASPFGAGFGKLREVCGAFSGAMLVLGFLEGYSDPEAPEEKKVLYSRVQEYARGFKDKNGAIVCRELLKDVKTVPGKEPEPRTPEFYTSRPCLRIVESAAETLEEMLKQKQNNGE